MDSWLVEFSSNGALRHVTFEARVAKVTNSPRARQFRSQISEHILNERIQTAGTGNKDGVQCLAVRTKPAKFIHLQPS